MVRKKNPASDLKMKIYNESLSSGKKCILQKKKMPTLLYQLIKIKGHTIGWSKEKATVSRLVPDSLGNYR